MNQKSIHKKFRKQSQLIMRRKTEHQEFKDLRYELQDVEEHGDYASHGEANETSNAVPSSSPSATYNFGLLLDSSTKSGIAANSKKKGFETAWREELKRRSNTL
jgi:hypothetical protein